VQAVSRAIVSTTAYDSGWTALASRGLAPSRMRRKPAACSKALGGDKKSLFEIFRVAGVVDSVKDIFVPISWWVKTRTTMV